MLIWSAMGTRETRYRTSQLIFSSAHPLRRQLSATLLAGVIVALLAASGVLMRLIPGNWIGVLALVVGALFIRVYAGTSKLSSRIPSIVMCDLARETTVRWSFGAAELFCDAGILTAVAQRIGIKKNERGTIPRQPKLLSFG